MQSANGHRSSQRRSRPPPTHSEGNPLTSLAGFASGFQATSTSPYDARHGQPFSAANDMSPVQSRPQQQQAQHQSRDYALGDRPNSRIPPSQPFQRPLSPSRNNVSTDHAPAVPHGITPPTSQAQTSMMNYEGPSSTSAVYHSDTVVSGPEGRSVEADVSRHLDPALDGQERTSAALSGFMSTHHNIVDDPGQ